MNFKNKIVSISAFSLTCFLFLQTACTADPPPTLRYKDREIVDSLFRVRIDTLKPFLDSLCEVRHDSAVRYKVDSILEVRISEKEKYLERLRKEQSEQ